LGYLLILASVAILFVSVKWWNCDWKIMLWTLTTVDVYTFWFFALSL